MRTRRTVRRISGLVALGTLLVPASAQETEDQQRDRQIAELREQNAELGRRIDLLADELERINMG